MGDRINEISAIIRASSSAREGENVVNNKEANVRFNIGDVMTNFGKIVNNWENTFIETHQSTNSDWTG